MVGPLSLLLRLNSAELALLSYLLASLLGAAALLVTERAHETRQARPAHHQVEIRSLYDGERRVERHTRVEFERRTGIGVVDAWFTATSALCVTGLVTTDFSQFTPAGQLVVLVLMQIGGLGIFVFTSILLVSVFHGVEQNLSFRSILAATVDSSRHDALAMVRYILIYTAAIEGGCALVIGGYLSWGAVDAPIGGHDPWWWAVFHAVSAFNNAGFSLMPDSLEGFVHDPVISLSLSTAIILGGIGFPVLIAFVIHSRRLLGNGRENRFSGVASPVQVKLAIYGTAGLLLIGTGLVYWLELENATGQGHGFWNDLLAAWFQSAAIRTAGFNSLDIGSLHAPTLCLFMILMFIGANPAGTGGGIKIPTVAVLVGYLVDWFKAPGRPVVLFGRPVSRFAVSHAIRLFFFASAFVVLMTAAINYVEREYVLTADPVFSFTKILFEVVSAFSTTGLSMGVPGGPASFSALFSDPSKILLIVTMLFGRIGPLVLLAALPWKRRYADHPPSPDVPDAEKVQIG